MLRGYEDVLPGSAERLFALAERQADHRQAIEKRVIDGNVRAQTRGQWFAFILSILFGAAGFELVYTGHGATGLATIIGAIGSLVTVFIVGRTRQEKERAAKRAEQDPKYRKMPDARASG